MSGDRSFNHFNITPASVDWPEVISWNDAPTPTARPISFRRFPSGSGREGFPGTTWPIGGRVPSGSSGLAGTQTTQTRVPRFAVLEDMDPPTPSLVLPVQWGPPLQARPEQDSKLTRDEQNSALKNLKKEIYNPTPKRFPRRVSLYYREQARNGDSDPVIQNRHDVDDVGKRCAICLEDFEPKEEVRVTPCDHMFHEECIVPWVKSHGQCPVCRSIICDRSGQDRTSYNNNGRGLVGNDRVVEEIASMIRLMEEAIRTGRIGH